MIIRFRRKGSHAPWRLGYHHDPKGHEWYLFTPWFGVNAMNNATDIYSRRFVTGFRLAWGIDKNAPLGCSPWRRGFERTLYTDPRRP